MGVRTFGMPMATSDKKNKGRVHIFQMAMPTFDIKKEKCSQTQIAIANAQGSVHTFRVAMPTSDKNKKSVHTFQVTMPTSSDKLVKSVLTFRVALPTFDKNKCTVRVAMPIAHL